MGGWGREFGIRLWGQLCSSRSIAGPMSITASNWPRIWPSRNGRRSLAPSDSLGRCLTAALTGRTSWKPRGKATDCERPGKDVPGNSQQKQDSNQGGTQKQDRQLDRIPQIHIFITEASHFSNTPASLFLQPFHFEMGGKGLQGRWS